MLLPLMRPQFLETAVALAAVVGTPEPVVAVVFDAQVHGLPVAVQIAGAGEGFGAEGAGCTRGWDGRWEDGGGEGVWGIGWWSDGVVVVGMWHQRSIGVADVIGMRHQRWVVESSETLGSCDGRCLLWWPEVMAGRCNSWIVGNFWSVQGGIERALMMNILSPDMLTSWKLMCSVNHGQIIHRK